jgi:predicted permease
MAAAVLLAYVPRLPSAHAPTGLGISSGGLRITPSTNRRLRVFATTQIAFSFVLLAAAGMLISTLVALQNINTGYNTRQVLALDVPPAATGVNGAGILDFYDRATQQIRALPGVDGVSSGVVVPWRDAGGLGPGMAFTAEGYTPADGEENPIARIRPVGVGFFGVVGIPLLAGREFNDGDRSGAEPVSIVSQSVALRLFSGGDALNRKMWWVDPYVGNQPQPRRIVGIVADVDDEHVVRRSTMLIYQPVRQIGMAMRLFVRATGDPYTLVPAVTRVIREISPEQPVARPATLEDVRSQVLSPDRLNAFVLSGFAGIALLIAVVGVSGVLAFSVSARTREFGIRMAIGSTPRHLLLRVVFEGTLTVAIGILAGTLGGYAFAKIAANYFGSLPMPGAASIGGAATVLIASAIVASLMPAARASRVDLVQALRSE